MRSFSQLLPFAYHLVPFFVFEYAFRKTNFVIHKFDKCANPEPFHTLWGFGAMGNTIACDELNSFWVFAFLDILVYPLL